MNYVLLTSNYVVGVVFRQVRVRSICDLWTMGVATLLMMFAYHARESDSAWCTHEDSIIQGHAIWHASMALGIMFFYFFLRQERPWVSWKEKIDRKQGEWMERTTDDIQVCNASGSFSFFRSSSSSSAAMNTLAVSSAPESML